MAEVVTEQHIAIHTTDAEWRLIMKALAHFAGLKVTRKNEDIEKAKQLNRDLLTRRRNMLAAQLEIAEGALLSAGKE